MKVVRIDLSMNRKVPACHYCNIMNCAESILSTLIDCESERKGMLLGSVHRRFNGWFACMWMETTPCGNKALFIGYPGKEPKYTWSGSNPRDEIRYWLPYIKLDAVNGLPEIVEIRKFGFEKRFLRNG